MHDSQFDPSNEIQDLLGEHMIPIRITRHGVDNSDLDLQQLIVDTDRDMKAYFQNIMPLEMEFFSFPEQNVGFLSVISEDNKYHYMVTYELPIDLYQNGIGRVNSGGVYVQAAKFWIFTSSVSVDTSFLM